MRIQKIIGILTLAILALNLVLPLAVEAQESETVTTEWTENPSDYMTVSGVLDSDYYVLYPYELRSLKIGFSKYGEMINTIDNVGLEYDTVDPFAPPAGSGVGSIPKNLWVQGWLINITYYHATLGLRNVWAAALHGDSRSYGGPWLRVDFNGDYHTLYGYEDPRDPGYIIGNYAAGLNYGGRKTNGTAITYPIQVLYNGPRRFVAQLTTDIYDHPLYLSDDTSADIPLVRLIFTIIFNKVKKEVNIIKDVKSLLTEKVSPHMKVQFSNRGEVDLGTETKGYHSYFHFWTNGTATGDTQWEGQPTVYNDEWTLLKTQDPSKDSEEPPAYQGLSAAGPFPQSTGATFDVAQAYNNRTGHVWFAAFWPSLSDWTIDGWDMWWRSLDQNDPHYIDAAGYSDSTKEKEPKIPFYIGEWDFILKAVEYAPGIQFRGVTMYGVVNAHNAYDDDMDGVHGDYDSIIDREVYYYLNETFNPWDLRKAVDKTTRRHVEFQTAPANGSITLKYMPVEVPDEMWDQYCVFSERVIDLTEGYELEARNNKNWRKQDTYTISGNVISGLDPGHYYKILYSTGESPYVDALSDDVDSDDFRNVGRYEWIVVGKDAASVDSVGAALVAAAFKNKIIITHGHGGAKIGIAGEDIYDPFLPNQIPYVMRRFGMGYDYTAYLDGLGRAALNDDWCTYWPVSSSNMIFIGGAEPWVNLGAYYFNDFTDAFSDFPGWYTADEWKGKIIALTCWSKNTYSSSEDTGYAVITTYKDLNGTVGFLVYGHWGRDTYYACQWLHGDKERHEWCPGIIQLEHLNDGVTSIILEIDYTDPFHPAFSIVEHLGTKSEKLPIHEDP